MYISLYLCCTTLFLYSLTSTTNFENSWLKNQKKLLTSCPAFSITLLWNSIKPYFDIRKTYQVALGALVQFIFADDPAIYHDKQG